MGVQMLSFSRYAEVQAAVERAAIDSYVAFIPMILVLGLAFRPNHVPRTAAIHVPRHLVVC